MPRNNKQAIQAHENFIKAMEIDTAEAAFNLLKPSLKKSDVNLPIFLLKGYFEQYKKTQEYKNIKQGTDMECLNACANLKQVKGMFDKPYLKNFDPQDVTKMSACVQLTGLSVSLVNKTTNLEQRRILQGICLLMNRIIPYYPMSIRDCWDLDSLLKPCEKMRKVYFNNFNRLMAIDLDLSLSYQMQITYLCAMMMWISNTKSIDYKLIINAVYALFQCKNFFDLFKDKYNPSEEDIIFILPTPLRIIDILLKYYENLTISKFPNKVKLLTSLNQIKKGFFSLQQQNPLHMLLINEFIFFLDKIVDFAVATSSNERGILLAAISRYHPLLEKIYIGYRACIERFESTNSALNEQTLIDTNPESLVVFSKLIELRDKWALCANKNKEDNACLTKIETELVIQEEMAREEYKQALQAKLELKKKQQKEKKLQEFLAKKLKNNEKLVPQEKINKKTLENQFDQQQKEITDLLSKVKSLEEKEKLMLNEIGKYLEKDTPVTTLESLHNYILSGTGKVFIQNKTEFLPKLLFWHILLLDDCLTWVKNNAKRYKKTYGKLIDRMKDKYGHENFAASDRRDNNSINNSLANILKSLVAINVVCVKILIIFSIINILKNEIKDNEFYKAWNFSVNFREEEYSVIYTTVLSIVTQFQAYRKNKQIAFELGKIPTSNKKYFHTISESQVADELTKLIGSFEEIQIKLKTYNNLNKEFSSLAEKKEYQTRKVEILKTTIDPHKLRIPLAHNPHESFRRSQSFSYTKNGNEFFCFFKRTPIAKNIIERKNLLLKALKLLGNRGELASVVLSEINRDQDIDAKKFISLFEFIKDNIKNYSTYECSNNFANELFKRRRSF